MLRLAFLWALVFGLTVTIPTGARSDTTRGEHSPYIVFPAGQFDRGGARAVVTAMQAALLKEQEAAKGSVTLTGLRPIREQIFSVNILGRSGHLGLPRGSWVFCQTMVDVARGQQIRGVVRTEVVSVYLTAISCRQAKTWVQPERSDLYGSAEMSTRDVDVLLNGFSEIIQRRSNGVISGGPLPDSFRISRRVVAGKVATHEA